MDLQSLAIQAILLVAGFVMLVKGSDWFVDGASAAADLLGVSQLTIGLTIVAFGTSAPEAAVSISSSLKGSAGIAIGNVLGSNIVNILLIMGLTAAVAPIPVQRTTIKYEIPFVILVSAVFLAMGAVGNEIDRIDAALLLALLIAFLVYSFKSAKSGVQSRSDNAQLDAAAGESAPANERKKPGAVKIIALIIIGGVLIVAGGNVTVSAASEIAALFGVSPRIIGLTIVAFGTSLPELVTSLTAALKGKNDIAVGNIVGSNIFNILFVIGAAALIRPIEYGYNFILDNIVCILSALLLLLCAARSGQIKRRGGVLMLAVYAVYLAVLFTR